MRARERPTRALEPVKMRRCYIIVTIATLLYGPDTCTLIVLQFVSEYALREIPDRHVPSLERLLQWCATNPH